MKTKCIEFGGYIERVGYGRVRRGGVRMGAHRFAWSEANGPIPKGLWVLHTCDNRKCINPKHLFLGTAADNSRDMCLKGRSTAKLKLSQAMAIKRLLASGLSQRKIAKQFGVHRGTILHIHRGLSWRHAQ